MKPNDIEALVSKPDSQSHWSVTLYAQLPSLLRYLPNHINISSHLCHYASQAFIMLLRPSFLRAPQCTARRIQTPILRNTLQRRFAGTGPTKLEGPMDNAFNRERLAVKQHAAQSAGMSHCPSHATCAGPLT